MDDIRKVIVQLNGGLGNQMFQYAAGRAIAHRNQAPLGLDKSIFRRSYSRPYRLDCYQISDVQIADDEINQIKGERFSRSGNVIEYLWEQLKPRCRRKVFQERSKIFDPEVRKVEPPVYLEGYWQSEKYFDGISSLLRREFRLKDDLRKDYDEISEKIRNSNAVSIHIRRGDYVTNPVSAKRHGVLPLDYYYSAVQIVAKRTAHPEFYIFSDDILWVKEYLKLPYGMTFVSGKVGMRDFEEMHLLSLCKFHIIANSSFSWWGAWLSSYADKYVIVPKQWFADPTVKKHDIVPSEWIGI